MSKPYKTLADLKAMPYESLTKNQKRLVDRSNAEEAKEAAEKEERARIRQLVLDMIDDEGRKPQQELIRRLCPTRSKVYMRNILDKLQEEGLIYPTDTRINGHRMVVWARQTGSALTQLLIPRIPEHWKTLPVSMIGSADHHREYGSKSRNAIGIGSTFSDAYGWEAAW